MSSVLIDFKEKCKLLVNQNNGTLWLIKYWQNFTCKQ